MAEPKSAKSGGDDSEITKKDAEIDVEVGTSGLIPDLNWASWAGVNEDGKALVVNRPLVTVDQIVDMRRRDGQAKALIQLVLLPIRLALQNGEWIEPEEGDGEEETEFANLMFNTPPMGGGMTTSKSRMISQILLAVVDGFAPFEIVRRIPDKGPLKGKITLRKLAYRDPRTVTILVDAQGGYAGFRQVTTDFEGEVVDVSLKPIKTVLFTNQGEYNPHYGVSQFESAYPHFDAKRKLYYIAHLAAQFAAVPGRIGEYPNDATRTERINFANALSQFAFNTSMIHRAGYKVSPFSPSTGFDFLKLIEHHNAMMSKSILAAFFDESERAVIIDNSDTEASADLFLSAVTTIANDLAETMTHHLMPQFIDLNFNSGKYPVYRPAPLSDAAKSQIRDLFKVALTSGILNSTPEFVREMEKKVSDELALDIDYNEIEKREKEAAEAQQAQQEEQDALAAEAAEIQAQGGPPGGPPGTPAPGSPDEEPVAPGPDEIAATNTALDNIIHAAQKLIEADPGLLSLAEEPDTQVDEGV